MRRKNAQACFFAPSAAAIKRVDFCFERDSQAKLLLAQQAKAVIYKKAAVFKYTAALKKLKLLITAAVPSPIPDVPRLLNIPSALQDHQGRSLRSHQRSYR